jgi:hypothetical protein
LYTINLSSFGISPAIHSKAGTSQGCKASPGFTLLSGVVNQQQQNISIYNSNVFQP